MTDGDDLLERLGAEQRRRDESTAVWEALARGELSTSEAVHAHHEAGQGREATEVLAAVVHPDGDDAQRWLDVAADALGSREQPDQSGRGKLPWVTFGAVLLAAALALLWVVGGQPATSPEPLSEYTWVVRNEYVQPERGVDVERATYHPGSDAFWVVRPEARVDGRLEVAIIAQSEGVTRVFVPPTETLEVSEAGVVQLRGTMHEIAQLEKGRWSLRILVGRQRPTDAAEFEAGGPWTLTKPRELEILPP